MDYWSIVKDGAVIAMFTVGAFVQSIALTDWVRGESAKDVRIRQMRERLERAQRVQS